MKKIKYKILYCYKYLWEVLKFFSGMVHCFLILRVGKNINVHGCGHTACHMDKLIEIAYHIFIDAVLTGWRTKRPISSTFFYESICQYQHLFQSLHCIFVQSGIIERDNVFNNLLRFVSNFTEIFMFLSRVFFITSNKRLIKKEDF